jgi:hypothetical protein
MRTPTETAGARSCNMRRWEWPIHPWIRRDIESETPMSHLSVWPVLAMGRLSGGGTRGNRCCCLVGWWINGAVVRLGFEFRFVGWSNTGKVKRRSGVTVVQRPASSRRGRRLDHGQSADGVGGGGLPETEREEAGGGEVSPNRRRRRWVTWWAAEGSCACDLLRTRVVHIKLTLTTLWG